MYSNLENLFRTWDNDQKVLSALRRLGPLTFTQIHEEIGGSEKTLSKHFMSLCSNSMVDKLGKKYHITKLGIEYIDNLEKGLKAIRLYEKKAGARSQEHLVDCTVEVGRLDPPGHVTIGTFKVSLPRRLQPMEREELDKALTQAIRILSSAVPEGTRGYEVAITRALK